MAANALRTMLGFGAMLLALHLAIGPLGSVAGLVIAMLVSVLWSCVLLAAPCTGVAADPPAGVRRKSAERRDVRRYPSSASISLKIRLGSAPDRERGDQGQEDHAGARTPQGAPAIQPTRAAAISGDGPPARIEPSSRAKAKPE